jgi:hypothetical protein
VIFISSYVNLSPVILFNGYSVQGWSKSAQWKMDNEPQDCTSLADTTRIYKPGLENVEVNIEGYDDYAATTGMDARYNLVDGATVNSVVISEAPQGVSAGKPSYTGTFNIADYNKNHTVGEMVKFTINAKASGSIWFKGTVLEGDTSVSGAGSGTERVLGAVSATQGVYGALHVTMADASAALVVKVQSDDINMASWVDRITFSTMSVVGAEVKSTMGANADTHWRCTWTIGGGKQATFTVCVGIR